MQILINDFMRLHVHAPTLLRNIYIVTNSVPFEITLCINEIHASSPLNLWVLVLFITTEACSIPVMINVFRTAATNK